MAKKIGRPKIDTKTLKLRGSSLVSGRKKAAREAKRPKYKPIRIPSGYGTGHIWQLRWGTPDKLQGESFGEASIKVPGTDDHKYDFSPYLLYEYSDMQRQRILDAWPILRGAVFEAHCRWVLERKGAKVGILPWAFWEVDCRELRDTTICEAEQIVRMDAVDTVAEMFAPTCEARPDPEKDREYLRSVFLLENYPTCPLPSFWQSLWKYRINKSGAIGININIEKYRYYEEP